MGSSTAPLCNRLPHRFLRCVGQASFLVGMLILAPVSEARAAPAEYCDAFAKNAANNKTGQPTEAIAGRDEHWRDEYGKALNACLENYTPSQISPSEKSVDSQNALIQEPVDTKPKAAKSSHRKKLRKIASRGEKKTVSRVSRSKKSKRNKTAPSLCRHLTVTSKGHYRVENC